MIDGIDICGDRALIEIEAALAADNAISMVSLIGYSLGGLILRYVIGRMYFKKLFETVMPITFMSIASPHLGAKKAQQYKMSAVMNYLLEAALFRIGNYRIFTAGKQLACSDKFGTHGTPLLQLMADKR